jgi:hypothetical protein
MTKRNKIIYWISTIWLASGMLSTEILQLFKAKAEGALAPPGVYGITHLGYPVYFLTILGIWKILGVVALLVPKFPLLKEWTYAGIANPTVVSWCFRPADRKIIPFIIQK